MKKFDSINVIPFIDIILVLLAIVLATASFISQGKISVNVPKSQSKETIVTSDMVEVITIKKDGQIFYNDKATDINKLKTTLLKFDKNKQLTLKVDAQTNFQHFVLVTDLLKASNIKKVSVITHLKK